jgi:hypothetical protein
MYRGKRDDYPTDAAVVVAHESRIFVTEIFHASMKT